MALKLTKSMRDGGTAEYWRLAPVAHYEIVEVALECHLMLYVNEEARRSGKHPVAIPNLDEKADVPGVIVLKGQAAKNAMATGDPRGAFYTHLKTLPFFEEAEDVLEED